MRLGLFAAADETRLLGNIAKVRRGFDSAAVSQSRARSYQCPRPNRGLRFAFARISWTPTRSTRVIGAASSAAPAVANGARSDSLCSKASSTSLASAAARRFLAASASWAQITALSADVMFPTVVNSLSLNAADYAGSRVLGRSPGMRRCPLPGFRCCTGGCPFPGFSGRSSAGGAGERGVSQGSGASRSSSPANQGEQWRSLSGHQ